MFSSRLSVRCPLSDLFHMLRYLCTQWRDFHETCDKYSPCEWALGKSLPESEVRGLTECYNGDWRDVYHRRCGVEAVLSLLWVQLSVYVML